MHEPSYKEIQETAKALQRASEALIAALENIETQKYLIQDQQDEMVGEEENEEVKGMVNGMATMSIFDKIPDFQIDESLEMKIVNLKMNQFTSKRKEDLFKKHKKEQEEKISTRRKEVDRIFFPKEPLKIGKEQFTIRVGEKTETFPMAMQDMDKLKPQADLNDTIVGNYLKMFNFVFLPSNLQDKCFFYSSFFMQKLIGEYAREDIIYDRQSSYLVGLINNKVKENYKNVKRWTKKISIFERDILILPINAFKHWFCIMILRPRCILEPAAGKAQIVYCDSMFEKRDFIVEAIRRYLELELQDKHERVVKLNQENLPCYQLLLPRQTNAHDCGLYMLSYIEELLGNPEELIGFNIIANRKKLKLFPRTLIFTMRERLRKLFARLINASNQEQKSMILAEYKGQKDRIIQEAEPSDFDQLNEKEYKKYEKMNITFANGTNQEEKAYLCLIRFYMDPEINFYEKDK